MTSLPAADSWSHRLSLQLQSLSVICETLTLRLLELEERMGHWDEQKRCLEEQASVQAGSAAALVDVLEATGQRLASLESLLEGEPGVVAEATAAPPRLQVLHAQPRRRAQVEERPFEAPLSEASPPEPGDRDHLAAAEAVGAISGARVFGLRAEEPSLEMARSMPAALQRPERRGEADDVFPEDEEQRFMDELTA
jgi:hypothetical protein